MEDDTVNLQTISGEEIVVTGLSGVFPNSESVQEFMENLYNKVDMVSDDPRWTVKNPEVPNHIGKVNGIEKFDAQFFKVGYPQAKSLEPMSRKLLEHAYGAIFDSGNTHATLKGKVIGVFIGSSYADFSANCMYDIKKNTEFVVVGSSKTMLANRISYWLDGKGPSYCVDYSCTSSDAALEQAYRSIRSGDIDAAVVGGCNLCCLSAVSLHFKRAGFLCQDGKTKCFDKKGDGYVRSEAVSLIFLQKAKDAKRVYAEVYHAHGAYQLKDGERFLPLRKSEDLQTFLKDAYSKTDVDPNDVEYVEANGAALAEADDNEVAAIANVFAGNKIVKIGSVKSNMGHSEPASGLCALTKLCLAYHKGQIPANLHCQDLVQSAKDGRVQVVTEHSKFGRGFSAMNSLSFTGSNFHVVLKGHYKKKNLERYTCNIPRIVLASARKESGVSRILDHLKSKQADAEELALLHNIFQCDITGHTSRGYAILDTIDGNTVAVSESIDHYIGVKPTLWFVYSGMGSQWAGMGTDLMRIPTFAAAIQRCDKVLAPKGIDIVKVITETDNKIFDNILHSFVGIGAVQIGLTDILKEMGVMPDYIIGHSLGEMACAYHDNTFTTEELILSTYSRGKAIQDTALIKGSMAAVGLGYKDLVNNCPPEIDIGCHNSSESTTISGPADVMKEFVGELTRRGIFARIIPSVDVAFHSRYVADAGPVLLRDLREIIKNPKPRSKKWITSSVPRVKWDDPVAKYSSAEYHTNNLLNPVLFEEVTSMIPRNAVVVEIAPHSLLQAILKRSLKQCTHIPLTKRGVTNGVAYLLNAVGKLYQAGFNPKVDILYPTVNFPVSTETPLLSHLIEWEHSEDWPILLDEKKETTKSISRNIIFCLEDNDYKYLEGYIRNGVNVLPEAALLAFVWETLAMHKGKKYQDLSVVFKDIQFHNEVLISYESLTRLSVMISKGNDTFEVTQGDDLIVTGIVSGVRMIKFHHKIDNFATIDPENEFQEEIKLSSQEIYRDMKMRGYDCKGQFQSIFSVNLDRTKALIKWTEHWVPFLDSLIQLNTVSRDFIGLSQPKLIKRLKISVLEQSIVHFEEDIECNCFVAQIQNTYGVTRCAGVEIEGIVFNDISLPECKADVFKSRKFVPYCPSEEMNIHLIMRGNAASVLGTLPTGSDLEQLSNLYLLDWLLDGPTVHMCFIRTALEIMLQIISENSKSKHILLTKVVTDTIPEEFEIINELIEKEILVNMEIKTKKLDSDESILNDVESNGGKTNVIFVDNMLQSPEKIKAVQNLSQDTFLLSLEKKGSTTQFLRDNLNVLSSMSDGKKEIVLMRKLSQANTQTDFIPIKFSESFIWVSDVMSKLNTENIVLVSEKQPYCGALGLVRKLKADGCDNISIFIVDDINAPTFDPKNDLYREQMQKNMTFNIMRQGQWGSFYFTSSKQTANLKSFALKYLISGNLESLSWVEAPKISGDKTLAQVCYAGLSAKDQINVVKENAFGMDFSGIDGNGERIMGLIAKGSVATSIETYPDLLWPVPDHWTLEDAATVPLAYVQAYYCLTIRSRIEKGKLVLIQDGTSSVGLALISLCLHFECIVFAVVDRKEKQAMLFTMFPQLNENNIIFSEDDGFYHIVMTKTERKGCDIVVNFTTGYIREVAAKSVGFFGLFVDFSQNDSYENKSFGMSFLSLARSYVNINVLNIFRPEYSRDRELLQKCLAQGIDSGVVKPLSRVVFTPAQVTRAFNLLSQNNITGTILIRVKEPTVTNNGLETIPRLSFMPQDVSVIVCDERGIGIELADRLIKRGARKIVLHMKPGPVSGYIHSKFRTWNKQGVSIKLFSDNLQTERGCGTFIKNAIKFGKIKGFFVVFDSKQTDNRIKEAFVDAFKKQTKIAIHLDVASRNCIGLSYFVILHQLAQSASSECAISVTEQVCDKRNEMGLPSLVLRFGSLLEIDANESAMNKLQSQPLSTLFNIIETSLQLEYNNVVTFDVKKEDIKKDSEKDSEYKDPLYSLYEHIIPELDNVTSQKIVVLPSLVNNCNNIDWDSIEPYIILIPGFEGRPQIFESVAERLKMGCISIELGPDLKGDTIQEIARSLKWNLGRQFSGRRKNEQFHIMGYSFGVNIALELARILEMQGLTGHIRCIDSSPDGTRAILDAIFDVVPEDILQNHVLNHMYNVITKTKGNVLKADLRNIDTYEAKVEETLKRLSYVHIYTRGYKKLILESAYKRILMARTYEPMMKLRSTITLMKSPFHLAADKLPYDYGLSKYSYEPVEIHKLVGERDLSNVRISNITNLFVDRNL